MKTKYNQMTSAEILSSNPVEASKRHGASWVVTYTKLDGSRNTVRKTFADPTDFAFWVRSQEAKHPQHSFCWVFTVELAGLSSPVPTAALGYIDTCNRPMCAEKRYASQVHNHEDSSI